MEITILGTPRSPDITSFRNRSDYFHRETKKWAGGWRGKEKPFQWKVRKLCRWRALSSFFKLFFRVVSILQHRGRKDGLVDKGRGAVDSSESWPPFQLCCRHPVQPWTSHHLPMPFLLLSKTGVKPCLLAVLWRTHGLRASVSQSLERSCREGSEKQEYPQPFEGSRAVPPSWGAELFQPSTLRLSLCCGCLKAEATLVLVVVFSKIKDGLRQNTYSKNYTPEKHRGTKLSEQDRILCTSPQSKCYHMCIKRLLLFTECWHETPWKS